MAMWGMPYQIQIDQLFAEMGFKDACISSRVLPFVSGTNLATNKTVSPHTHENAKNVPEQNKKHVH